CVFFFSSRRRHTRFSRDWSSDVCSSDLEAGVAAVEEATGVRAIPGGSHPGRGTANFLLGLAPTGWPEGAHTYLEILGPDPQQERSEERRVGKEWRSGWSRYHSQTRR